MVPLIVLVLAFVPMLFEAVLSTRHARAASRRCSRTGGRCLSLDADCLSGDVSDDGGCSRAPTSGDEPCVRSGTARVSLGQGGEVLGRREAWNEVDLSCAGAALVLADPARPISVYAPSELPGDHR